MMLTAAFASSCVVAIAWLASRRFRKADHALWHAVWSTIAAASLVAPLVALAQPVWQVAVRVGPAPAEIAAAIGWAGIVAAIGVAAFGVRLVLGCRAALRLRNDARHLTADECARVEAVATGIAPLCRINRRVRVPVVTGWRPGAIVLPESFVEWPADRLQAILLHERQHVLRHDFLWNVVASAQQVLYWWNPLAWLVSRRVRLTAELASDRAAAGAAATAYARHLVATAEDLAQLTSSTGMLAPGAVDHLEARVDALLESDAIATPSGPVARVAVALVAAFVIAIVVLTPGVVRADVNGQTATPDHTSLHLARHHH